MNLEFVAFALDHEVAVAGVLEELYARFSRESRNTASCDQLGMEVEVVWKDVVQVRVG